MDALEIKKELGQKAAQLIQPGMIVGLGTGSTAECFIHSLIHRVKTEKLSIQAVASSEHSSELARAGGVPVMDLNEAPHVDITVDGADEIDPQKRLIKGAGGALLREKILASASRSMVVLADESKLVSHLGKTKLPIEILSYGAAATRRHIEALGYKGSWRLGLFSEIRPTFRLPQQTENLFVTDNGHLIFDLTFSHPLQNPEQLHSELIQIPGVLETGFFFHLAKIILIGHSNGQIKNLY